jgi:hypothetical protein
MEDYLSVLSAIDREIKICQAYCKSSLDARRDMLLSENFETESVATSSYIPYKTAHIIATPKHMDNNLSEIDF